MSLLARRRLMMQATRHPNDGKYCYVLTNGAAYYSTDYGATFQVIPDSMPMSMYLAVDDTGKGFLDKLGLYIWDPVKKTGRGYFTANTGTLYGLSVSTGSVYLHWGNNSGTSWTTGYSVQIKRSVNLGNPTNRTMFTTWDRVNYAGACSLDGKYALIGGASGYTNAFYTNNFGDSWAECLATQSYGNESRAVAVSGTGKTALTTTTAGWNYSKDYLATWTQGNAATTWWGCDLSGNDGYGQGVAFLTDGANVWRGAVTVAGEISWTKITTNFPNIRYIKTNFYGTRCLGIGRIDKNVYYSSNGGYTWATSSGIPTGNVVAAIAMNKSPN